MGIIKHSEVESPKVSVLTPIYNVAQFLPECLESLQRQKLSEIEFICINDGSTDNSLDILKMYAENDERFTIIDKANSGYGASMNCGIDAARGEYIGIVESDDFADKKMFKTLYKYASKNNCDIVKSNYFEHSSQGDFKQNVFVEFPYKKVFQPANMLGVVKKLPIIWAAIYRRRMLIDHDIRFNETAGASFQDTSFVQRCWFASSRVMLLPGAFLHYRVDNSGSSVKSAAKIYEVCTEFKTSEDFIRQDSTCFEAFAPVLNVMKLDTYRWNYNRIAHEYRLDFVKKWAEEFRSAFEEKTLIEACFTNYDWGIVQELLDNPETFFEKYKEAL